MSRLSRSYDILLKQFGVFEAELADVRGRLQRIVAGVAGQAEMIGLHARRGDHALDTQVVQGIESDESGDFRHVALLRGNQLSLGRKIDAVGAGMARGRAAHDHVDFLHAVFTQVPDAVAARRSADDGIFHDHDLFPGQQGPDGVQLDAHAEIPHGLRRLDERAAHVMVSDHAHFKGNAAFLGVPEGGVVAGVGKGHGEVHIRPVLLGQAVAEPFPAEIDVLAENLAVRPREIDQFEDAMGRFDFRERRQAVQARLIDDDDLPGLDIPDICVRPPDRARRSRRPPPSRR